MLLTSFVKMCSCKSQMFINTKDSKWLVNQEFKEKILKWKQLSRRFNWRTNQGKKDKPSPQNNLEKKGSENQRKRSSARLARQLGRPSLKLGRPSLSGGRRQKARKIENHLTQGTGTSQFQTRSSQWQLGRPSCKEGRPSLRRTEKYRTVKIGTSATRPT